MNELKKYGFKRKITYTYPENIIAELGNAIRELDIATYKAGDIPDWYTLNLTIGRDVHSFFESPNLVITAKLLASPEDAE